MKARQGYLGLCCCVSVSGFLVMLTFIYSMSGEPVFQLEVYVNGAVIK